MYSYATGIFCVIKAMIRITHLWHKSCYVRVTSHSDHTSGCSYCPITEEAGTSFGFNVRKRATSSSLLSAPAECRFVLLLSDEYEPKWWRAHRTVWSQGEAITGLELGLDTSRFLFIWSPYLGVSARTRNGECSA